ncbi:hypothetical protein [Halanaeroarchaeum sp. HSR-CO]|uniref:hypothetical protein n=1 Tax=Halanaeroarchaeum sp. HSR-CO TaxID=2866382 RepID=UPI00217DB311|nr:hypothetical protein [Halanaeroarchaeum sp. HSR-CO]
MSVGTPSVAFYTDWQRARGEGVNSHKTPGVGSTSVDLWPDTVPDAERATRIVRRVADTLDDRGVSYGVRFPVLVENVTGEPAFERRDGGIAATAAYHRVLRSVEDLVERGIVRRERIPDYSVVDGVVEKGDRENGDLYIHPEWVPPTLRPSHLKVSRQTSSRPDPETPNRPTASGWLSGHAGGGTAAAEARSVLRGRAQIMPGEQSDGVRAKLGHALAAHRQGVDTEGMRPDTVSSTARATRRQATYFGAWDAALDRRVVPEDVATHVTLTPDSPGSYGDLVDVAAAVNDDVDDLLSWLGRHTPGPGRPLTLVIRETTRRGRLHIHVVVFGVAPQHLRNEGLGDYWAGTKGHGFVNYTRLVRRPTREGRRWLALDDDAGVESGTPIRGYLAAALNDRRRVTELNAEALHEVAKGAERGGLDRRGLVQTAILWATGVEAFSASPALLDTDPSTPTPSRGHVNRRGNNVNARFSGVSSSGLTGVAGAITSMHVSDYVARPGRDRPPPAPPDSVFGHVVEKVTEVVVLGQIVDECLCVWCLGQLIDEVR